MRKIFVFSGAGISAESGVPTFRDSNGLWENHKVSDVATPDGWKRNPSLVLDFYKNRQEGLKTCQPNPGHLALAKLQEKFEVINVTQNIDDLLERAGCKDVRHLHGSLFQRKCEHHRNIAGADDDRSPGFSCDYQIQHDVPVVLDDKCPKCSGRMRPAIVWFGEAVMMKTGEMRKLAYEMSQNDGIFIVVGTSGKVYPAANLIPIFSRVPNKYLIDPHPGGDTQGRSKFKVLQGPAGIKIPQLANELLA